MHGYRVRARHDSKMCNNKGMGHKDDYILATAAINESPPHPVHFSHIPKQQTDIADTSVSDYYFITSGTSCTSILRHHP